MSVQPHHKKELIAIVHKYLPRCAIWLFGSRATGRQRVGSDVDVALDNGQKIPWHIITKIMLDIEETTIPMAVDVVDLATVDDAFKHNVLKEGILWTR